jgi:ABC-type sugar transport system permease subunit
MSRSPRPRRDLGLLLLVVPSLAMVLVFCWLPASSAVVHAFQEWGGGEDSRFIGLDNFVRLAHDKVFWGSCLTILVLVVANILKLIPSILLAVLIHRMRSEKAQYWYRIAVVLPMIVPALVTLFVWKGFFDANLGALNALLDATGVQSALVWLDGIFGWGVFEAGRGAAWLGQPGLVLPALILWGFPWLGAVGVLIYLAGLQAIGAEVYEAAELDGADGWQIFWRIELPLILGQVRTTLTLLFIGTIQGFGLQYLLLGEGGGPDGRGMVPGLWMFNRAFFATEFGYACAIGLVLALVIMLLTWLNHRFVKVER